ncbi:MAG: hypothetical protein Kow0077_30270 [Anaerolineae bacterium]
MQRPELHERSGWFGSWARWLKWFLLLELAVGVMVGGLLALGAADPPVAGTVIFDQAADRGECLQQPLLPAVNLPATLRITATVTTPPEALTTWGVWVAAPQGELRWEVLPPGYYRFGGHTVEFFHVGPGANTLQLNLEMDGTAVLWLNRERALETMLSGQSSPVVWGLYASGDVCWERITLFGAN